MSVPKKYLFIYMKKYTKQSNARRTLKNKKRSYQQKLQLFNGGDGDDDFGHNECGICYLDMNEGDSILLHPAENNDQRPHKFHKDCIAPMLETNTFDSPGDPESIKCPYCEFAVNKEELRQKIGFNLMKYTVHNVREFIHWMSTHKGEVIAGMFVLGNAAFLFATRDYKLVPHVGGEQHLSEKEKEKENISEFHEKFLFVPKKDMDEFIEYCQKNKNELEKAFKKDGPITIMYRSTESKSLSKSSKTKRSVFKKSKRNKNKIKLSSNSI
jgi:hypothetical protein